MPTARFVAVMLTMGMMILGAGGVSSQTYPSKPIRIITAPAGGGSDILTRLIAQGISGPLGQPVIVENRPTVINGELVSKALPDGYTLLLIANVLWVDPLLVKTRYDPVRDFSPITLAASALSVLVVHPSLPVKSVKELIALAKAKPGELNYGSGPRGSTSHLSAELFKALAGVNIMGILYTGTGPALNALISGEVQVMISTAGSAMQFVKSGRLRALGVTSAQPSAWLSDFPTVAASGVPGYESLATYGVFAPAKTPVTVINRLNHEVVRALNMPNIKEKLFNAGIEVVGSSPKQLTNAMKSEMAALGKMIKDTGIRAE